MSAAIFILTFTYIAFIAFAISRLMNYLHALQQDDYDNVRLSRWIIANKVYDKRVTTFLVIVLLISVLSPLPSMYINALVFLGFCGATAFEKNPRKDAKKAFVLTQRAKRILTISTLFAALIGGIIFLVPSLLIWILAVQLLPALLILGNASLAPQEAAVQKRLAAEARAKLDEYRPKVIGITGSYGKTSVKHILGHILNHAAPTLVPPGSTNTMMGTTRIIREQLQPNHKYMIAEMGAYGPGSITKLCSLTPPDVAIISSIGHAHYERFKTLETVVQAKYELAQAAIAKGGKVIVHEKTLKFPYAREIRNRHIDNFIVCGESMQGRTPRTEQEYSYLSKDDLHILGVEQTSRGLVVSIEWGETRDDLKAPLYGVHHGHNIALAYACARDLGMEHNDIKMALSTLPQIRHRLEVKRQVDNTIIIDDAFNSNPPGFRAAVHVMRVLADDTKGRGILVTPGIVELGEAHDEVHKALGILAAEVCDIVIAVSPSRIPTFIEGYEAHGNGKMLYQFNTFKEAEKWLVEHKKAGDVILLENDLPDIYERKLKI